MSRGQGAPAPVPGVHPVDPGPSPRSSDPQPPSNRRKISVVISAHNDSESVVTLARRLVGVFDSLPGFEWEAVVVDDGSDDATLDRLEGECLGDPRFKIVQLARSFGTAGSQSAGLATVDADAVVLMVADLTDRPELIPRLVASWESGYENVYFTNGQRKATAKSRGRVNGLLYALIGMATGDKESGSAGDFRLLDRRVYQQVRAMQERNRSVSGMATWVGSRSLGLEEQPSDPGDPTRKTSATAMLQTAVKTTFSHSQVPLVVIPLVGVGLAMLSFVALISFSIDWLARGVPFPGFGTIVALMVMLFGILFCMLGVISIYIGLIYEEAKGRPNFVIRRKVGFGSNVQASFLQVAPRSESRDGQQGDQAALAPEAAGSLADDLPPLSQPSDQAAAPTHPET